MVDVVELLVDDGCTVVLGIELSDELTELSGEIVFAVVHCGEELFSVEEVKFVPLFPALETVEAFVDIVGTVVVDTGGGDELVLVEFVTVVDEAIGLLVVDVTL